MVTLVVVWPLCLSTTTCTPYTRGPGGGGGHGPRVEHRTRDGSRMAFQISSCQAPTQLSSCQVELFIANEGALRGSLVRGFAGQAAGWAVHNHTRTSLSSCNPGPGRSQLWQYLSPLFDALTGLLVCGRLHQGLQRPAAVAGLPVWIGLAVSRNGVAVSRNGLAISRNGPARRA
jgi:hypothetical protein